MAVSRRGLMLAGVVPAVAVAAYPGAAAAAAPGGGYVSAPDLGIAPGNTGAQNRTNLVVALSGASPCVVFPPGDYLIDNGGERTVEVVDFGGQLVMQPGARLVFTDNTKRAINFKGGSGARMYGLTVAFVERPVERLAEGVVFLYTHDTYLEDVRIDGSAGAGLIFWQCIRPMVADAVIANTMADGLHFANCQDGRADRVTTVDTGDDGVAFVNYATSRDGTIAHPAHSGGLATNISVTRSKSRGVAVVGQSGVTVRDVIIDQTRGHGLYCAYEEAWRTRVPTAVHFERARVRLGGAWVEGDVVPLNSGLRMNTTGTVSASGITIDQPGAHGGYVTGGTVSLSEIRVMNVASGVNRPGRGLTLQGGTYHVDRLVAEETDGAGFFASGCARLEYGTITVRNTARTLASHQAIYLENTPYVLGDRLWIYDDASPATGYVIGTSGAQRGSLGTIVDGVAGSDVVIDNRSSLAYTRL